MKATERSLDCVGVESGIAGTWSGGSRRGSAVYRRTAGHHAVMAITVSMRTGPTDIHALNNTRDVWTRIAKPCHVTSTACAESVVMHAIFKLQNCHLSQSKMHRPSLSLLQPSSEMRVTRQTIATCRRRLSISRVSSYLLDSYFPILRV